MTQAENAQENYKDQVIELKQEVKKLKNNGRATACSSRIEDAATTTIVNKENDDS